MLANPETTRGNNYDLSGAYPIDLIDLLRILADELGKHTRFVTVPFFLAYAGAWALYLLTFAKLDLREKVQRLVEPRAYTHAAASRDFGYAPMDLETGLRQEVRACRTQWRIEKEHRAARDRGKRR